MPIPSSHLKERLSVAYVRAVTARAGALLFFPEGAEYGTDGIIQKISFLPNGRLTGSGWNLSCQLKSTTDWIERPDCIVYDLEVEAYNKLVCWEGSPCILVLLRLPKDEAEWLHLDEQSLSLRNCCYWTHLVGAPSNNNASVRISIPRNQLFTPDVVNNLLDQLKNSQEGIISYELFK